MEESVVSQTIVDETVTDCDESRLSKEIDLITYQVELISKEFKNVVNNLRNLKKDTVRLMKVLKKKKKYLNPNRVKREPSGFVSPILLSDELADFLGEPRGIQLPRTIVTKRIVNYVKEFGLKDSQNGRFFDLTNESNPNVKKLKDLLNAKGNEVGYFNLQTYLKRHFTKRVNESDVLDESINVDVDTESKSAEPRRKLIKKKSVKTT
jgi:chromatin remodeling complex protein RSC6